MTAEGGVREGGHLAAISWLASLTLRGQEADSVVVAPSSRHSNQAGRLSTGFDSPNPSLLYTL